MSGDLISTKSVARFLARIHDTSSGVISRSEAHTTLDAFQRRWSQLGIRPGDIIAICLPNGTLLLEHFFAALAAGAVPVLLPPSCPSRRQRDLAELLGVRAVIGLRLASSFSDLSERQMHGPVRAALFPPTTVSHAQPGEAILLTSGTSGFLSGCVFAMDDLLLNAERHADSIGQTDDDTVLVSLPLYYSFALVAQALATFVRGGRLVIDGPPFNPSSYGALLARHCIAVSSLTPALVRTLFGSHRSIVQVPRVLTVGGDSLTADEVARLLELRGGRKLYLTYGLTQAGPRVTTLAAHCEPESRYSSVGRPIAGTSVSLKPISNGSATKQLFVSSQTVMRRRIGLVEGGSVQQHPWRSQIATGDIFEQDAHGYLYFLGRLSDVIVKHGDKLRLAAVRRVAMQMPGVVHAKTQVVTAADGGQDYDLLLCATTTARDYHALLRRQLRKAEMPRRISITSSEQASLVLHK